MTNFTKYSMMTAAALLLAGAASAETLKADVPFAFRMGDKLMQPGTYLVSRVNTGATRMYRLTNIELKDSALAVTSYDKDPNNDWKADAKPRVAFACGVNRCDLSAIYSGAAGEPAHQFSVPKNREQLHVEVVVARPEKGE